MLKKITLTAFIIIFSYSSNIFAKNSSDIPIDNTISTDISIGDSCEDNIYIENDSFKVINIHKNNTFPINSLIVYNKKDNTKYDEIWSSAVVLNNNNLLLGKPLDDGTYNYYEFDKYGNITFLINLDHYIKKMTSDMSSFITIENVNGKYYSGLIDTEFNTIYNYIFLYDDNIFSTDNDIIQVVNGNYGVFSSSGKILVEPIFSTLQKYIPNKYISVYNSKDYILKKDGDNFTNITMLNKSPDWVKDSIKKAIKLGFLPQDLQINLTKDITRANLCKLIVTMYEKKTGFEIKINKDSKFLDTTNKDILKAYSLGIISGRTESIFDPNIPITREEVAVVLANLIKKMELMPTSLSTPFNDKDDISLWAKDSVEIVNNAGIMTGDKNKYFHPKDNYTMIEAISTIMRIYELK